MKLLYITTLLFILFYSTAFGQNNDSQYFTKNWKQTTKDSAYYYSSFSNNEGLFTRRDFVAATNLLHMEGGFLDKDLKTRQGTFKWYHSNGVVRELTVFDKGTKKEAFYFYENGNKRAHVAYVDGKIDLQEGWDEEGKEIKGYIVEKPAEFAGGKEGWKRYLEKNLNASVAANAKAPNGNYTVKLTYVVDEKGLISNVNTVSIPALCAPCAVEAIRVMQHGPAWEPAIQFGKPVTYRGSQSITFQVAGY